MIVQRLARTTVEVTPSGLRTVMPDGITVHAEAHDTPDQRATAELFGYILDTLALTREHDLARAVMAELLGLPCRPALASARAQ